MTIRHKTSIVVGDQSEIFSLFARLPIELRFKIWTYNLPGPRIVEIKCSTEESLTSHLRQGNGRPASCKSTSPIPVNLHACRESRLEGLKRYRLLFGVSPQPSRIFFDPSRDTLYFGAREGTTASETLFDTFVPLVQPEDLTHVHHIAINEGLIGYGSNDAESIAELLCQAHQHLINLEQLTVVCDDMNPVYSSEAVFVEPIIRNRILERQIRQAISIVDNQQPQFRPLLWRIRAIAAEPNRPRYDQSILGYRGSRLDFFKEVQLPKYVKAMTRFHSAIRA
ncbi:hypothetical protein F4677DRAFT_443411 [Hypoxylon crocopeplum]|nr:hypothetical protein F4677DRAFT_443411 [Hypoxylon crocopeplum]